MQEGAEALLTHGFKGSAYTAVQYMSLIESTGYSSIARTNTAAALTAAGGGSPANGWNEATSSMIAARLAPAFGTASSSGANSDLATSATVDFTITGAGPYTIKGVLLMMRSKAGTAPTSTIGNTSGAIWSAGLLSADRVVSSGDQIKVTYTGRLTT